MTSLQLFATSPKGTSKLLIRELEELGARRAKASTAGVAFRGHLELAYRACLWCRTANRVLLQLDRFPARTPQQLYAGIQATTWSQHVAPSGTLAVDLHSADSQIRHSRYGAQVVKDAIVDQLRAQYGTRPSVELKRPDVRVNVYLRNDIATLSLDLAGESLHRRGYREEGVPAPLKENLAAAVLLLADWPALAREGAPLIDPLCGSGTLLLEAALMAGDIAPGLQRDYFGVLGWLGHDARLWTALLEEAYQRRERGLSRIPPVYGYDVAPGAVRVTLANVKRAGLARLVHVETRELAQTAPPSGLGAGLLVANPPYGERLGDEQTLQPLYRTVGQVIEERFSGWRAAILSANPRLRQAIGLPAKRSHALYNGPLPCQLQLLDTQRGAMGKPREAEAASDGAHMLANRLRKNLRHLRRWARRSGISCYRIYDTDLPEYALAVDLYQGDQRWAHVQEYQAPPTVHPARARERLRQALPIVAEILEIAPQQVFQKQRRRQRGRQQYPKLADRSCFHTVQEGPCRFLVNFTDHLDTGLFLDHRLTRDMLQRMARGQRFLNLFGYTGTATVHAAVGGARSTTTVDMSATYLDWARRNFELNRLDPQRHQLVKADCLAWLAQASHRVGERYGLIFLDPPTFSNSKRMSTDFDLQRDHPWLLRQTARLLAPDGILIFSTNRRKFKLDQAALAALAVEDISRATIPEDFARNPRVHHCWRLRQRRAARS
ncbi:MAG: bifunctional 23S rRNA (guanine(2069)-N(7))-methyltransferase RlmK/23S rRNA (guanine(2445)-N(2))-methyltransferase RlmL [Gammaproteobacteria bacterium]|nr:bifunctional 23S rRNA (guanine(2069)-N(7))-methyltransferase RlmK/23S rRNA (guanine(2445)-N(2))-methyltransferase RlmL [Gammaproteobacteria bacterium]